MPLIALQDRLGDVFGFAERPLLAPSNKAPQRDPAASGGVLRVARHGHPFQVGIETRGQRQMRQWIGRLALAPAARLGPRGLVVFYSLTLARHALRHRGSG